MPELFKCESNNPICNAQRNLSGRTHYVDPDTLRFHKSRIISARHTHEGLLFAIVTSDALDHENKSRGFRFVIFDIFGTVLHRTSIEDAFRRSDSATAAMWKVIDTIDAKAVTLAAIERYVARQAVEIAELTAKVKAVQS